MSNRSALSGDDWGKGVPAPTRRARPHSARHEERARRGAQERASEDAPPCRKRGRLGGVGSHGALLSVKTSPTKRARAALSGRATELHAPFWGRHNETCTTYKGRFKGWTNKARNNLQALGFFGRRFKNLFHFFVLIDIRFSVHYISSLLRFVTVT